MAIPATSTYADCMVQCRSFYQFSQFLEGFQGKYKESRPDFVTNTPITIDPARIRMSWLGHTTLGFIQQEATGKQRDVKISFEGAASYGAIKARFNVILNQSIEEGTFLGMEQDFATTVVEMERLEKAKEDYLAKTCFLFRLIVRIREYVVGCFKPFNLNQVKEKGSFVGFVLAHLPHLIALEKARIGEPDAKEEDVNAAGALTPQSKTTRIANFIQTSMNRHLMGAVDKLEALFKQLSVNPSLYSYLAHCLYKYPGAESDERTQQALRKTWPERMPLQGYGKQGLVGLQLYKMVEAFQKSSDSSQIKAFFEHEFAKSRANMNGEFLTVLQKIDANPDQLSPDQLRMLVAALSVINSTLADDIEIQHATRLGITETTSGKWQFVRDRNQWERCTEPVTVAAGGAGTAAAAAAAAT